MVSVCTIAKFTRGDEVYTNGKFLSNITDVGTMLKNKILQPAASSFEIDFPPVYVGLGTENPRRCFSL